MTFDFDTVIDRRSTWSTKYEKYRDTGILPLWVADMDFRAPEPVIEALTARIHHGVYGYTDTPHELIEVIIERLARLYDWHIGAEDLVFLPGVVPGINVACRALTTPAESIITPVPIYAPFIEAPVSSDRELKKVTAAYTDGAWSLPGEELAQAAQGNARLLLLCNPYNPAGRVLTKSELEEIVEICREENVIICSDEIHCDILFDGRSHVPSATVCPEAKDITITLLAPSKTFNLAGLGGSFAVIQNPQIREKFEAGTVGIMPHVSAVSYAAMLAAYRDCEDWRRALVVYLTENRDFLASAFERIDGIEMNQVEGTYLAWLDVSGLGLDDPPAFFEAAGVGMAAGEGYGDDRFMRLNFGCPRIVLVEAVNRIETALSSRG